METLIINGLGTLSAAITWIPLIQFQRFYERLEGDLSNGVIKVHIGEIKTFANLAIPWIIAHGPRPKKDKLWPQQHLDRNTSFERSLSKLSENHNIFNIGLTVLKFWLLKDVQLNPYPPPLSKLVGYCRLALQVCTKCKLCTCATLFMFLNNYIL